MLNKLARKHMTIMVGKRRSTLADEVDSMIVISVAKTDNPVYEVQVSKPRPQGNAAQYQLMRGQTIPVHTFEESPVQQPSSDWSDLD